MHHWPFLLDWWLAHGRHLGWFKHALVPVWPHTFVPPSTCTPGGVCTG
jgi:hypothetical protein